MAEKFNRSYEWWSDTPQDWRNDGREVSILEPKWNRSLWNINEFSEEEEVTETQQRTRKIIRGGRKNRDSSDSETRLPSRVKWQFQPEQQKEAENRLLSFWQLIGGEVSTPVNINRELVATSEETSKIPEETTQGPISITPATPNEKRLSDVRVNEVDFTQKTSKVIKRCVLSNQPEHSVNRNCKNSRRRSNWTTYRNCLIKVFWQN